MSTDDNEDAGRPIGDVVTSVLKQTIAAVEKAREQGIDCELPSQVSFVFKHDEALTISFTVPLADDTSPFYEPAEEAD